MQLRKHSLRLVAALLTLALVFGLLPVGMTAFADAGETRETAQSIQVNQSYSDSISYGNDDDWFTFSLPKPGETTITFRHPHISEKSTYWSADLTDEYGDQIATFNFYGNEDETTTCLVGLPAGKFCLHVSRGSRTSNQTYTFQINYTESNYAEQELDETREAATAIQVNKSYRGSINDPYDDDWYRFSLDKPGETTITFRHPHIDNNGMHWSADLTDEYGDQIASFNFSGAKKETTTCLIGLPAGKFCLHVSRGTYTSDLTYTFRINYTESSYAEQELDDSRDAATAIKVNKSYRGSINDPYDDDWYRFSLSKPGETTITFQHPYISKTSNYWSVDLTNEYGDQIASFNFSGAEKETTTCLIGLPAGKFCLHVSRGTYTSDLTYTFRINYTESSYAEQELDDSRDAATAIKVNKSYRGSINDSYDDDWYRFSLSKPGETTITFQHPNISKTSSYWSADLTDEYGNEIASFSFQGSKKKTTTCLIGLPAGKFCLHVSRGTYTSDLTYTFRINFTANDYTERENNEDYDHASPMVVDEFYRGSINDAYDDDFYLLTVPETAPYQIVLFHPTESTKNTLYSVRILTQNEKTEMASFSVKGSEGFGYQTVLLEKGKYYVKVDRGSSYSKATYTLLAANPLPFTDVKSTAYYYEALLWAYNKGIVSGTSKTRFSPNAQCTRSQVVSFLWRANGSPKPAAGTCPYTDVKKGDYFYDAVLWAVQNGITQGVSSKVFGVNEVCTRGQVVTFLWRSAGQPEPKSTDNPFTDVSEKDYYYKAVLWAVGEGITSGLSKTKFGPGEECTRAQIVSFLYRAYGL